jgi:hypothetical protein
MWRARSMTKMTETSPLDWAFEVCNCLEMMFSIYLAAWKLSLMIDVACLFVLETRNRQIDSN